MKTNPLSDNPFSTAVKHGKSPLTATNMLTPHEFDSPAKIFMRAGKSFIDNVLKTVIPDKRTADAIASIRAKYKLFGWQDDHRKQVKLNELMALWSAQKGRASFFALQGMDQVISEKLSAAMSGINLPGTSDKELERALEDKKKEDGR